MGGCQTTSTTSSNSSGHSSGSATTSTQAEVWRKSVPKPGPQPQPTLPVFERAQLKNGLTVMVIQNRTLPLVSFRMVIRGGSREDPQALPGLTAFSFGMLDEGAAEMSALEFSDAVADLGASFSAGASQDSGYLSVSGLSRNRDQMLELMSNALLKPRLEKKDFRRIQEQTVASLMRRRGSASGLAFEYVPGLLYGDKHPYGHPASGTVESVKRLKLKHVRRHLPKVLSPHRASFVASGDVSLEEAKELAEKYFGQWKGTRRPVTAPPAKAATARERITLIHKDNSPQTMIILYRPMFGRGGSDEIAALVTNQIYGGSFTARLNFVLREEKGYTYGARAFLSLRDKVGAYLASSKVRQDVTGPALSAFVDIMDSMKSSPPTDAEISRAKDGLVRSLTGQFESINAASAAAESLFVYRLPLDRYAKLPEMYSGISREKVAEMTNKYLVSDLFHVILVGDSKKIMKQIKETNLGPVKLIVPKQ